MLFNFVKVISSLSYIIISDYDNILWGYFEDFACSFYLDSRRAIFILLITFHWIGILRFLLHIRLFCIKLVPPDVCMCNYLRFASVLTVYVFSLTAEELRFAPLQARYRPCMTLV